jgi:hypothetical protein
MAALFVLQAALSSNSLAQKNALSLPFLVLFKSAEMPPAEPFELITNWLGVTIRGSGETVNKNLMRARSASSVAGNMYGLGAAIRFFLISTHSRPSIK